MLACPPQTALLPLILLAAVAHAPVHAQDAALAANPQADALAIAEQLYNQARGQTDESNQKLEDLRRAADLFADYLQKYPNAKERDKALYLQAICREEAGNQLRLTCYSDNLRTIFMENMQQQRPTNSARKRLTALFGTRQRAISASWIVKRGDLHCSRMPSID